MCICEVCGKEYIEWDGDAGCCSRDCQETRMEIEDEEAGQSQSRG